MRKFIFILFGLNCIAQAPSIEWQTTLGGTAEESINSIAISTDGGYLVAGYSNSTNGLFSVNHGNNDGYFAKLSTTGAIEWQKLIGGSQSDTFSKVISTSDGGFILVGTTQSNNFDIAINYGQSDIFVVKINPLGITEWIKSYGGVANENGNSIAEVSSGGYIISGTTSSTIFNGIPVINYGGTDSFLLKINQDGTVLWVQTYGSNANDSSRDVILCSDGGFATTNTTSSNNFAGGTGYQAIWVFKTNAIGELIWQKVFGWALDWTYSLIQTSDNGYLISGNSASGTTIPGGHGSEDAVLIKLDNTGNLQWQNCYGGTGREYALSVFESIDGNYVFAGATSSQNNGQVTGNHSNLSDFWIVKVDTNGSILWQNCYGGTSSDFGYMAKSANDNGIVAIGRTNSNNGDVTLLNGSSDAWVVKLAPEVLANEDFKSNSPQLYPNPTSGFVNIHFSESVSIDKIILTNPLGEIVKEITNSTTRFDASDLSTGVYLVQIISGNTHHQVKFIKK